MKAFIDFVKAGFVVYESKLAKLLNVAAICILGMVFVSGKENMQRNNIAHVARLQYVDDVLLWLILWAVVLALCPFSFKLFLAAVIVTLLWSNFFYALTAFISWCIALKAGEHSSAFWASIYYLDQVANSNKIARKPFGHLWMFKRAFTPGRKFVVNGFLTALAS